MTTNLERSEYSGNLIQLTGAYAPSTQKLYFEMSKFFDKKLYMDISIIYLRSSSFARNQYFLGLYEKEKVYLLKSL
jgi:hypothetical protein